MRFVDEFESTEEGLNAFARSRGVNPSTLHRWVQQRRRGFPLLSAGPSRERATSREVDRVGFSEVMVGRGVASIRSPVVVHLPLGVRVEIPAELVEGGLRRLLREVSSC
jgi:transposase-like protein